MFLWRPGLWKKGQLVVLQIEAICGSGGSQHLRERQFSFFTLWVYCRTFVSFLSQIIFQNYKRYYLWLRGIQAFTRQFWVLYFTIWFFSNLLSFHIFCCDSCFCQNDNFLFSQFSKFSHLWLRFFNFDKRYVMKLSEQEDGLKTCFHGRRPFCEKPDRISGPFRRQMSNSRTEICEE